MHHPTDRIAHTTAFVTLALQSNVSGQNYIMWRRRARGRGEGQNIDMPISTEGSGMPTGSQV